MPETEPRLPITSFSRISSHTKCPEFYRLKYVDRIKAAEDFNPALTKGRLVHGVLEDVLSGNTTAQESLYNRLPEWLKLVGLDFEPQEVYQFALGFGELLYRASMRCRVDPIRNKDGSVPKDVENYPPAPWTQALKQSGLYTWRKQFDDYAGRQNAAFIKTSFSYLVGDIFSLTVYFKKPKWAETIAIEMPFSTNENNRVLFPHNGKDLYFRGYIDWLFKLPDGRLVICDHKTESKKPTPNSVLHHPQLNLYAGFYSKVYGVMPDIIAINHLISGEIVMAAVEPEVMAHIFRYYSTLQNTINMSEETALFAKHHPGDYNSPCIKYDWKTGEVSERCPYLDKCWPTFVEATN